MLHTYEWLFKNVPHQQRPLIESAHCPFHSTVCWWDRTHRNSQCYSAEVTQNYWVDRVMHLQKKSHRQSWGEILQLGSLYQNQNQSFVNEVSRWWHVQSVSNWLPFSVDMISSTKPRATCYLHCSYPHIEMVSLWNNGTIVLGRIPGAVLYKVTLNK